jgi:hypothetical protein
MATDTDEKNRGQEITDEKLGFDPTKTAKGIQDAENYANDPDNASRDVKDQEEEPEFVDNTSGNHQPVKTRGTFWGSLGNKDGKGPILTILFVLTLLGGGTTTVIPGALVSMSKWLTNWSADDHRTLMVTRKASIRAWFSDKTCQTTGLRCKIRTVGKTQKERLEKAGFKLEGADTKMTGRFKISKLTTPSGAEFKKGEGEKFNNHIRFDSGGDQAAFYRALHPKASWFTHPKARFSLALKNFKFNRGKDFKASNKKDEAERKAESDRNFDRARDQEGFAKDKGLALAETQKRTEADKNYSKLRVTMKGTGRSIVAVGDLLCMAKTMIQTINAAVKLYANRELADFALKYLKIGDQIQNEGNVIGDGDSDGDSKAQGQQDQAQTGDNQTQKEDGLEPETVEWVMNNLTAYNTDPKSEKYGLTAMDSQGVKAAVSGDYDKLSEFTEHYTSWWASGGVLGSNISNKLSGILAKAHLDKSDIRTTCLALKIANIAIMIATGCGGVAGCLAILGITAGQSILMSKYADDLVQLIGGEAYKRIADLNLNSSLKGVDLGNAFAAGVGTIMPYKNRGSGLKPARDNQQIKDYIAATKEVDEDDRQYALEEAKENQLDPTNEYSFVGQLARFVNPYRQNNSTPLAYILNAFTLNVASLNTLNPFGASASALYSQPVELTNRPGSLEGSTNPAVRCKDPDLAAIGVVCILPGTEKYVTDAEKLKKMQDPKDNGDYIEKIIDYMQGENPKKYKYIDDDGKPIEQSNNEFKQWMKYCTEQREYPIGVSGEPLDQFVGSSETEGSSFFQHVVDAVKKTVENGVIPGAGGGQAVDKGLGFLGIDPGQIAEDEWAYTIQKGLPDDLAKTVWPELITEADMGYYIGARCAGNRVNGDEDTPEVNDMIDMFGLYYNICYSQLAVPEDEEQCYDSVAPQQAAKPCKEGWTYPVDKNSTTVTSGFGGRDGGFHRGIDLAGPIGTPIVAACDGIVRKAGAADGFGLWIVIDHDINGEKYSTVYGHVDTILVTEGQHVTAGQVIGTRGNRGSDTTGPHLHFEIWKGGRLDGGNAIDPGPNIGVGSQ